VRRAGSWQVGVVEAERFRLDGGAMFGVVPRPLWERSHPADDRHRIRMVTRCLVARGEGRLVVVDTGMGDDWSDKERDLYAIENGERSLHARLAAHGIDPADVTDVVLTHLHFDHVGGAVRRHDGRLVPVFPRAAHHVQQDQLDWAAHPSERDRRSFRAATIEPLRREGLLRPVAGRAEILPGLTVEPTQGHTRGHQVVRIGDGEDAVVYCGDLIPMSAHVPTPWVMAYDLQPLVTMDEKRVLLARAAASGEILVLEHDPSCEAVRVGAEGGSWRAVETVVVGPPA
jgi:glyoxylase-like metal-dependent hydrolase (beta-lactamase superfamily II)